MGFIDGVKERIEAARERWPLLDHMVRTVEHYSTINGSLQAGAVTYFAFISFFPILALAFAVIGYVARIYPDAEQDLIEAISQVLPGLVGDGEGEISLAAIRDSAPGILSVGIVVVLYSGLGWLSSMRTALTVVFELPPSDKPNIVIGRLRDTAALGLLGVVLVVSVGISGVVRGLSKQILELLGLASGLGWMLGLIALLLGLVANAVLFYALFKVLVEPDLPRRALWSGAALGAIGFEVLKQVSQLLLQSTREAPAFQAFGIALILVVWINYFSRVIIYAAAWAYTHPVSRALRPQSAPAVQGPASPPAHLRGGSDPDRDDRPSRLVPFAAGGATTLALVALLRKRSDK